uniref:Uncharacterized protein n=1 Tax=Meloidogyne enterolobii TaxID=390850 RepID=A0A6V7Y179_MELEN|nr:unnamed protein product [Meloidogyne enterolobii]
MEIAIKQLNKIEKLENENEIKRELNKWIKGKDFVEMRCDKSVIISQLKTESI